MKQTIKTVVAVAGIAVTVGWSVTGVKFDDVFSTFRVIDTGFALSVLLLTTGNIIIRAVVWQHVVSAIQPISTIAALSSYLVGVFSNLFLPFKLGDVAQGYVLGKHQHISTVSTVSAVVVQRIFEVCSLILIMTGVVLLHSVPNIFQTRMIIVICAFSALVISLYLVRRYKKSILTLIEMACSRISPKLARSAGIAFDNFINGTVVIRNANKVLRILLLSILSWMVQILMVKFTADALGIQINLAASSVVLMIINLGLLIPVAPGNIGTFQVFGIIALSFFSIAKSKALAFSILFQFIQGIPVIVGGVISLLHYYRK